MQTLCNCWLFLCQTPAHEAELGNQARSELHLEKDDTAVAGLSPEAKGELEASREAPEHEAQQEAEEQQQEELPGRQRQIENEVSEVEIPNVGRIMVRADADGYNEEVWTFDEDICSHCKNVLLHLQTFQVSSHTYKLNWKDFAET